MKKLFLYIFLLVVFSSTVHALPLCKGENKYKLFKSKKWHKCTGVEKQGEHKYEGEFKNGKFDGQGTLFWITGGKYTGEWKGGLQEGYGIYTSSDGKYSFNGEWEKGKRVMGITKYSDGKIVSEIYVDDKKVNWSFKKNISDGETTYIYPNSGNKYVGDFKNGFEHGKGTFITSDNNKKYVGEFKYGFRHGSGTLALYKSDNHLPYLFYDGEWKYDQKNGQGEEEYANGSKHIGNFINGKIEGDGTFIFSNRDKCSGYWKNGLVSLSSSDYKKKQRIYKEIERLEKKTQWIVKKKDKSEEEQEKIKEEIKKEINELMSEVPVLSENCNEFVKK